jgi:Major tropism determinant N-terminal domain
MPSVKISKIKVRRGSNDQRKFVTFDQGELLYTVDTKRLFVGTGTLGGEQVVGSKIHQPLTNYSSLSTVNAEIGDLVNVSNRYYQLTSVNYADLGSWSDVSIKIDPVILNYNGSNQLTLKGSSLSASLLNPSTISNGLKITNGILQTKYNTKSLELSATELSLKSGGIDEREINMSTLSFGLTGGSGSKIRVDANPSQFYYVGNQLNYNLTFNKLSSSWFGDGLVYNSSTQTISTSLGRSDNVTLEYNNDNKLSLKSRYNPLNATPPLAKLGIDQYGCVTVNGSSIYGTISGKDIGGSYDGGFGPVSHNIFSGDPSKATTLSALSIFQGIDRTTGSTVTLSSAGFITVDQPITTTSGIIVRKFAIPIFAY